MKLSPRSIVLVLGALAAIGLMPDTFNVQTPRTESLTLSASADTTLPIVLATAPAPTPQPPQSNFFTDEINELTEQRAARRNVVPSAPAHAFVVPEKPHLYESLDVYIHLPPDAAKYQPLRVLFVLHGMGGRGTIFSKDVISEADKNHWLLVAPTIPYTDYMDTKKLLEDDIRYTAMLDDMLSDLPNKLGLRLRRHALVYGFSRGAQLAHRFALFYPESVQSVAAVSAGSFTLPDERKKNDATAALLQLPYGVGDLGKYVGHTFNTAEIKKISFLIEVGEMDNQSGDVPRQFDPYVGKNRVERARAFQNALLACGVEARLIVFPGAGHQITSEMLKSALQFLREQELAKNLND